MAGTETPVPEETGAIVTTFTCDAAAVRCAFAGDRKILPAMGRAGFTS